MLSAIGSSVADFFYFLRLFISYYYHYLDYRYKVIQRVTFAVLRVRCNACLDGDDINYTASGASIINTVRETMNTMKITVIATNEYSNL